MFELLISKPRGNWQLFLASSMPKGNEVEEEDNKGEEDHQVYSGKQNVAGLHKRSCPNKSQLKRSPLDLEIAR